MLTAPITYLHKSPRRNKISLSMCEASASTHSRQKAREKERERRVRARSFPKRLKHGEDPRRPPPPCAPRKGHHKAPAKLHDAPSSAFN